MAEQEILEHPRKPMGENGEPLFDGRVHISNEKSGRLIRYQPFALHVFGSEKTELRERPIGSGNMFDPTGKAIGNWSFDKGTGTWAKTSDVHTAVKLHVPINKVEALSAENEALRAELDAIRADKETKKEGLVDTIKQSFGQKK